MWQKIENYVRQLLLKFLGVNASLPYQPMIGKYRARVVDNKDPMNQGRVRAKLLVEGITTKWARASVPTINDYTVPQVGTGVWIEFERFDPSKPIWTGCYYEIDGFGESNAPSVGEQQKVLKNNTGRLLFDDYFKLIGLFHDLSGSYMRMLEDGTFERKVIRDKVQVIRGGDKKKVLGSYVRSIGNELVQTVGKAMRLSVMGEFHEQSGDKRYHKYIADSYTHKSGGAAYTSGSREEYTADGYKLIMGINTPPTSSVMDEITSPALELIFKYLTTGSAEFLTNLFETNKVKFEIKESDKTLEFDLFGYNIKLDGTNKSLVIDDTNNGHKATFDSSGIIVEDGKNTGNKYTMNSDGTVIDCKNGNKISMENGKVDINGGKHTVAT